MKKAALFVSVILVCLVLFGCTDNKKQNGDNTSSETASAETAPSESVSSQTAPSETFDNTDISEESSYEESESTAEQSSEQESVSPAVSEETSIPPSSSLPEATDDEAVPSPEDTSYSEVDLSIDMPEPNGTMQVSADAENEYIKKVVSERGINSSLLVAVFSVPESGQNYVFEFYSSARSADNIRRVFFINSNGNIESVAASKSSERENLSATENWFSMNILIKQMIFPAVKDMM